MSVGFEVSNNRLVLVYLPEMDIFEGKKYLLERLYSYTIDPIVHGYCNLLLIGF